MADTLESKFNRSFRVTPSCWIWLGNIDSKGYARILLNGAQYRASRFSYNLYIGTVPSRLLVRHRCDNPKCVNPEHLLLGTPQDNSNDMVSRDRQSRGDSHPKSKVNEKDVLEIRQLPKYGLPLRTIANMYGITISTAGRIINKKTWAHIR